MIYGIIKLNTIYTTCDDTITYGIKIPCKDHNEFKIGFLFQNMAYKLSIIIPEINNL